jgi:KUP system potassium uptake protein
MSSLADGVPPSLAQLAERIHVVPERIVLLTIAVEHVPEVAEVDRIETEDLGKGAFRVIGKYGFMERPDVPALLRAAGKRVGDLPFEQATYFVGKETILGGPGGEMGVVTESIFAYLARNAPPATAYFAVPTERVVEMGSQIDL